MLLTSLSRNLGIGDVAKDIVSTVLPTIACRKLNKLVPTGFELSEMVFDLEIEAKLVGTGVSGKVTCKYSKE